MQGVELVTDPATFPKWTTADACFLLVGAASNALQYKFCIVRSRGMSSQGRLHWEEFQGNRVVEIQGGKAIHIYNIWGNPGTTVLRESAISPRAFLHHPDASAIMGLKVELAPPGTTPSLDQPLTSLLQWKQPPHPPTDPLAKYAEGVIFSQPVTTITEDDIRRSASSKAPHCTLRDLLTALVAKEESAAFALTTTKHATEQDTGAAAAPEEEVPASGPPVSPTTTPPAGVIEPPPPPTWNPAMAAPGSAAVLWRPMRKEPLIPSHTSPFQGRYHVKHVLGRGTWGEVRLIEDKVTGVSKASKRIPKCYVEDSDRLRQEIELMKTLDHPNIVRLYETFDDGCDVYIVMEFCSGGELFDRLTSRATFDEATACTLMRQILAAVSYCHSRRIAHRDLKSENFLFLNETPDSPLKLIDFGLASRFVPSVPMHTRAGTPYYVSPQVLDGVYGPECDVWSAGVIMYIILCGYPPFDAASDRGIMKKIRVGQVPTDDKAWTHMSPEAKDLLLGLLRRHPRLRLTAEEALHHPWFTQTPRFPPPVPIPVDILAKFRRFQGLSRLKKILLTVIARHVDEAAIDHLRNTFLSLNTSGSGILSRDEIRRGVIAAGVMLPLDIDDLINSVDTSGTGNVHYSEFIAACLNLQHYIDEETCRAAFRVFDTNADGKIDASELRRALLMTGTEEQEVAAELSEAGLTGDSEITFPEFVEFLKKIPSRTILGHNPQETMAMMKRVLSRGSFRPPL